MEKEVFKRLYEVYIDTCPDGELAASFETEVEAIGFMNEQKGKGYMPILIIQEFTKSEWNRMERDSLPGLEGYYI